jgi:hypothetical protein
MAAAYLFQDRDLPEGFRFPPRYLAMVEADPVPSLGAWWLLAEFPDYARYFLKYVREEYPDRSLIPFAKFDVFDDIACFDGADRTGDPGVYYVHAGATAGWEDRGYVRNFEAWLEDTKDD